MAPPAPETIGTGNDGGGTHRGGEAAARETVAAEESELDDAAGARRAEARERGRAAAAAAGGGDADGEREAPSLCFRSLSLQAVHRSTTVDLSYGPVVGLGPSATARPTTVEGASAITFRARAAATALRSWARARRRRLRPLRPRFLRPLYVILYAYSPRLATSQGILRRPFARAIIPGRVEAASGDAYACPRNARV